MNLATCIGCGCDDHHACHDRERQAGCYWLRVDRLEGKGVCSECEEHLEAWDRGDRTSHAEPAELTENPPRIPRPEQPRPPGIEPESGICRVLTTGGISIRFAPKAQRCPHDWPFEDVEDSDRCRWCGMSFIHHLFTDLPLSWDEQRGSLDGRATMLIKHLMSLFGCRIDLHKFVAPDDRDCFHTHPSYAVRIILRGAYLEELESGRRRIWRAGMIGLVKPSTSHRVHKLDRGRPAYSLWLRGPKIAEIKLRGIGWPVCQEHGCDKMHVTCWSCGGEGYRELYEEDPLWYDIDDVEDCDICRGDGGWLVCPVCCPGALEDE